MNSFQEIIARIKDFRDARDWEQFHNAKDLALAISVEAAELLELFLWKDHSEVSIDKIKEELADVFAYSFLLADKFNLDIKSIVHDKISKNEQRYPIDKSKGNSKKYTDL
jgi:NTP pyrophosphatase (non-canonical NTP hydrolase)